jgi:hypothetical protein
MQLLTMVIMAMILDAILLLQPQQLQMQMQQHQCLMLQKKVWKVDGYSHWRQYSVMAVQYLVAFDGPFDDQPLHYHYYRPVISI